MRRLIYLIFLIVLILSTGCSYYSKGPWSGRVLDAETQKPIEGAVVVAVWSEDYAAGVGRGSSFQDAEETLTDMEGRFEIKSKWFIAMLPDGKIMGPDITIFKPGYGSYPHYCNNPDRGNIDFFEKPGRVVELPKLDTKKDRIDSADWAHTYAPWRKTPILLKYINSERLELGFQPVGPKE